MAGTKTVVGAASGAALFGIAISAVVPHIQQFEGTRNVPYRDVVGVLTVCTGHTGPDVVVNKVYTNAECSALTAEDVTKAAQGVLKVNPQLQYHPILLASAISFSYNVGVGTYDKSSVAEDFNKGNFTQACTDLLKYTTAGGKYNEGLFNRRKQEYAICMSTLTPQGLTDVTASPTPSPAK